MWRIRGNEETARVALQVFRRHLAGRHLAPERRVAELVLAAAGRGGDLVLPSGRFKLAAEPECDGMKVTHEVVSGGGAGGAGSPRETSRGSRLPDWERERALALLIGARQGGRERTEVGDQASPAGLVRGTEALAAVGVEELCRSESALKLEIGLQETDRKSVV